MDETPIPCPEIILRAIIKARWIDEDTGEIKADDFIRDPARDADGLSGKYRQTDRPGGVAVQFQGLLWCLPIASTPDVCERVASMLSKQLTI